MTTIELEKVLATLMEVADAWNEDTWTRQPGALCLSVFPDGSGILGFRKPGTNVVTDLHHFTSGAGLARILYEREGIPLEKNK